jgi:hypothetical protein
MLKKITLLMLCSLAPYIVLSSNNNAVIESKKEAVQQQITDDTGAYQQQSQEMLHSKSLSHSEEQDILESLEELPDSVLSPSTLTSKPVNTLIAGGFSLAIAVLIKKMWDAFSSSSFPQESTSATHSHTSPSEPDPKNSAFKNFASLICLDKLGATSARGLPSLSIPFFSHVHPSNKNRTENGKLLFQALLDYDKACIQGEWEKAQRYLTIIRAYVRAGAYLFFQEQGNNLLSLASTQETISLLDSAIDKLPKQEQHKNSKQIQLSRGGWVNNLLRIYTNDEKPSNSIEYASKIFHKGVTINPIFFLPDVFTALRKAFLQQKKAGPPSLFNFAYRSAQHRIQKIKNIIKYCYDNFEGNKPEYSILELAMKACHTQMDNYVNECVLRFVLQEMHIADKINFQETPTFNFSYHENPYYYDILACLIYKEYSANELLLSLIAKSHPSQIRPYQDLYNQQTNDRLFSIAVDKQNFKKALELLNEGANAQLTDKDGNTLPFIIVKKALEEISASEMLASGRFSYGITLPYDRVQDTRNKLTKTILPLLKKLKEKGASFQGIRQSIKNDHHHEFIYNLLDQIGE